MSFWPAPVPTVAELAAAGVGAVLVPFPAATDDHQTRNAAWLVDAGAATLLPEPELSPRVWPRNCRPMSISETWR